MFRRNIQGTALPVKGRVSDPVSGLGRRDQGRHLPGLRLLAPGKPMGQLVEQAAAFAEAGVDIGIVYLPVPHTPAVLEPLAEALRPLAG